MVFGQKSSLDYVCTYAYSRVHIYEAFLFLIGLHYCCTLLQAVYTPLRYCCILLLNHYSTYVLYVLGILYNINSACKPNIYSSNPFHEQSIALALDHPISST